MEQIILSKNNKQTNKKQKQIMATKSRLGVVGGRGGSGRVGILGVWGRQTVMPGMDGQWNLTVQHREVYVIGSLCCTTELDETL